MMKLKKIFLCVAMCSLTTIAHAGMEQNVETCLTINSNSSPHTFIVGFDSTDFFDGGNRTKGVRSGTTCVSHTYKHGPKKISMGIGSNDVNQVNIVRDPSCKNFFNTFPGWVTDQNQKYYEKNIKGNFVLDQIPVEDGYFKYAFRVSCQVSSFN